MSFNGLLLQLADTKFLLPVVIGHQNAMPETFEFVIWDQAHGVPPVYMIGGAASRAVACDGWLKPAMRNRAYRRRAPGK